MNTSNKIIIKILIRFRDEIYENYFVPVLQITCIGASASV